MKQKAVIKVVINCDNCRSKIMKIAVGVSGVQSVTVEVDKGQIEVVGEGVDVVHLTNLLRKKVNHADVAIIEDVKPPEKKKPEEKKPEEKKPEVILNPVVHWPSSSIGHVMHHCACDDQPSCAIM